VSRDNKEGDLGIFFREGGQLSHELCFENNLYSKKEMNKDPEAKPGFLSEKRRIKALKLRGQVSEGFWAGLGILSWAGDTSKLKENDQFDTFSGYKICQKYYTPATIASGTKNKVQKKQKEHYDYSMLLEHYDTKQVRDNLHRINPGAILWATLKMHGTSQRTSKIKVEQRPSGFKRWWNKHFKKLQFKTDQWLVVSGTRRTIMRPGELYRDSYYVDTNFRTKIHEELKNLPLYKGECLYYEIVGFSDGMIPIMAEHSIEGKELKELQKEYGKKMVYSYGCAPGTNKIFVYRITHTTEDGDQIELSRPQIEARCQQLGLNPVPVLEGPFIYDGNKEELLKKLRVLSSGRDPIGITHIKEGIVLRVEDKDFFTALKFKNSDFCILEGIRSNDNLFVDKEDAS
jgi:hypothetical protein